MGHVRDRWMSPGPSGRKVRTDRWGHGKRWQARWLENGTPRTQAFTSRDAAELHLAHVQTGTRTFIERSLTVAEFHPVWLAQQLHYAPSTTWSVEMRFRASVLPIFGDHALSSVTRQEVQAAVGRWTLTLAPATVRQQYSYLTSMFAGAVKDGLIVKSPCVDINLPPLRRVRVIPLTVAQVQQMAERVNPWFRSMVIVGAATGMRGGELRGLTHDRISGGDVRIDRQLIRVEKGEPVWGPTKSQAGERRIALGAVASRALAEHLDHYGPGPQGLIWRSRQGGPVTRARSNEVWRDAAHGLGFRNRTGWHDLRHHHASLLIAAGLSPRAVADRLGHADASMTLRVYSHLWPDDEAKTIAAIDNALGDLQ